MTIDGLLKLLAMLWLTAVWLNYGHFGSKIRLAVLRRVAPGRVA